MMQPDIPNSFLKLLSEGFDCVEDDRKLRLFAVDSYISLLHGEPGKLPQRFLQVISWVLGEYSHLREELEPASVLRLLEKLLDMKQTSSETKNWVLMAMTKLCVGGASVSVAQQVSETYISSMDTVLRQRAQELQHFGQDSEVRTRVLPRDTDLEPLEVDSSLSFLDGFVSEALAAGAAPYKPPHQRQEELAQAKALSLEPYGLSLPISMSSCSIADRQSPTPLSMSSGLSGDSTDLSHKAGSTTLKLDGVKRVWGREGYLVQRESVEETAQVEVPSPLRSPSQQAEANGSHSQTPTQTPTPEPEQEKQQLAASLFFGLSSQSSVCLMGKSGPTSHRFRRKAKGQGSISGATEQTSSSLVSSPSTVDNLLCDNLLDSNIPSELSVSSSKQTSELCHGLTTANGACDIETKLNDSDIKGSDPSLSEDSGLVAADSEDMNPHEDPERPKDLCLSSHLPAELSGLCHSEISPLCSIQSLDLSACHVQKDDSLVLVIFIQNSSDSAIRQIPLDLDSDELEVSRVSDSPVEDVRSHDVAVYQYSLTVKRPSVHVEVVGTVSCPVGTPQTVRFSYKLPLTTFIRPLTLSTEEYGTMWLAFSHDTKQNLTLISDDPEPLTATLSVLKRKLQLHVVEIIVSRRGLPVTHICDLNASILHCRRVTFVTPPTGMEGILACRLLRDRPCLMHCRVHAGALAVWLRSPVPDLPDCLIYHCQRALQED
ncbi:hypothetical protein F2P81_006895 [Scophthalmus maximus]|uniref:AP-4 complex subunit epsilon-1 C-terminal domain-containing protein n=1 Tax=Scophthalmus maximus TaxID=52904 RepID=A0A6A4T497_SCOMX|nr:hypothetical protein F2P81_006895 [Scophthalmus maximus]